MSGWVDSTAAGRPRTRAGLAVMYRVSPDWRRILQFDGGGFLAEPTDRGESWIDRYVFAYDRPVLEAAIARAVRDRSAIGLEHRVIRADGSIGWVHSRAMPLLDGRGEVAEWFGTAIDLTEQEEIEAALRASAGRLAGIFESAPVGLSEIGPDGRFLRVNPELCRILGRKRGELLHLGVADVTHPDDLPASLAAVGRLLETGDPISLDKRYVRPDGEVVYASSGLARLDPLPGQPPALLAVTADLTARRRAEAALRTSEERLQLALAAARMGTWRWDLRGRTIRGDAGFFRLWGVPHSDEPHPLDLFTGLMSSEGAAQIGEIVSRAIKAGDEFDGQIEVVTGPAAGRWIQWRGRAESESPWIVNGVSFDVTEARHAESALRSSEKRLRSVAAHLPNAAVFVVGPDLRYEMAEGQALPGAGLVPADLEGKSVAEAMGPALAPEHISNYRRALAGESIVTEHASHGHHYATHLGPLVDDAGRTVAALAVSYDITDRVRAEEEVLRARDELEARVAERTAELAAEIERRKVLTRQLSSAQEDERQRVARDLHDSAGQLLVALSLALRKVELAGDARSGTAARLAEAHKVLDALARELHGLAIRLRPTSLDDLGLGPALRQLVEEWSDRTGVRADFQASGLGPDRLPTEIETTLYRVVQEALTNVAKHAAARIVSVVVDRLNRHVKAVVEDDGSGFDPSANEGRLGLIGMRERVDLVGGEFEVESSPGSGTTIYVRIPLPD